MARRPIKLPGLREYMEEVKQVTATQAAKEIVGDLIFAGPWYSGHFAKNWEVRIGDVRIPADREPAPYNQRRQATARQLVTPPVVPSLRGTGSKKDVGYTIGNRATYRNIAMDLEPGRTENAAQISAPQDWYRTYSEGGALRDRLNKSVSNAAQDPRVKGFKRFITIGPVGRLVNQ